MQTTITAEVEVNEGLLLEKAKRLFQLKNRAATIASEVRELEKEIRDMAEDVPEDEPIEVSGEGVDLKIGAVPNRRVIVDMAGILREFDTEDLLSIVKVNLSDVDKYLPSKKVEGKIATQRSGVRSISVKKGKK